MNEELKKEWEKQLLDLKCINGAMYFGSVEDDSCNCKTRCQNEQTFEHATEELIGFISSLLAKQQADFVKRIMKMIIMKNYEIVDKEYGRIILAEDLFQELADIKSKLK
jgi:hypothetical protein